MEHLPIELFHYILAYLSPSDITKSLMVNKYWHNAASSDYIWRNIIIWLPIDNIKDYINGRVVMSEREIIDRFRLFVTTVGYDQSANFNCLFPFDTSVFNVAFKTGNECNINETVVCMRSLNYNEESQTCIHSFANKNGYFSIEHEYTIKAHLPHSAKISRKIVK